MTDYFDAAADEVVAACERSLREPNRSVMTLFDEWPHERLYAELLHANEDEAAWFLDPSRSRHAEAVYATAAHRLGVDDA